jgi:hypothetical protein
MEKIKIFMIMKHYNYNKALNKLKEWAFNEGYKKISFNHNNTSYTSWKSNTINSPNIIKIEGKYSLENKTYLLLHELGHYILRKDYETYGKMFPEQLSESKRNKSYYVSCVKEEFMAWDEGFKLGKSLKIKINKNKWIKLKSKCIMEYFKYYSKK